VETPRNDAGIGRVFCGGPDGDIKQVSADETGLFIKGEVKNASVVRLNNGRIAYLFAVNGGELKLFELDGN
ncbi:hypothetical protein, partial [Echinicola sediminis]